MGKAIIWGTGVRAQELINDGIEFEVVGFVDSKKWDSTLRNNAEIYCIEQLEDVKYDVIIVAVEKPKYIDEIKIECDKLVEKNIIFLYQARYNHCLGKNNLYCKKVLGKKVFWKYFAVNTQNGNFPLFYGQIKQDALALQLLLNKRGGIFVDIGAHNGITFSNTYILEQLGWKGICIEANPDVFTELEYNRNCKKENIAVSDKLGEAKFLKVSGYSQMLSGLMSTLNDVQIEQMQTEFENHEGAKETIKVKTDTFNNIMNRIFPRRRHIDFVSIDVEGGEWKILKSIDYEKYSIDLLCVEKNYDKAIVHPFMESKGYVVLETEQDDFFVKR